MAYRVERAKERIRAGSMVGFTPRRKALFLENFRKTKNVASAAKAAGYSRRHMEYLRTIDDEFRLAWEDAFLENIDELEANALKRATFGVQEPIYQQGRLVGFKRKHDALLTLFMLKHNRPERYSDNAGPQIKPEEYAAAVRKSLAEQDELAVQALALPPGESGAPGGQPTASP